MTKTGVSLGNLRVLGQKLPATTVRLEALSKKAPPGQGVSWGKDIIRQGVQSLRPAWKQAKKIWEEQPPKAMCHFIKTKEVEHNLKCKPKHKTLVYDSSEITLLVSCYLNFEVS